MICRVTNVSLLKDCDAEWMANLLTRDGSEMREELLGPRVIGTPIAVVSDRGNIIAWAATHNWQGMQTLECYTAQQYRSRGIARFAAAALVAGDKLSRGAATAVFRPSCLPIAESVGLVPVLFKREGNRWTRCSKN